MSQSGEEAAVISHFFKDMKGGTYLEMGALDGVRWSNTLVLHKCQDWNGVLLEASPTSFAKLKVNCATHRPNAETIHGAVCSPPNKHINFYVNSNPDVSGDASQMSESFMRRHVGKAPVIGNQTVQVPCKPMREYLKKYPVINFWSLDIEGAELIALETTDFQAVHFDVILIEFDWHDGAKNYRIRQLLYNLNFVECARVVKRNAVFLNKKPTNPMWKCPFEEITEPSTAAVH
jgi:FkbM family methyltransferase